MARSVLGLQPGTHAHVACIGGQTLSHRTTREGPAPSVNALMQLLRKDESCFSLATCPSVHLRQRSAGLPTLPCSLAPRPAGGAGPPQAPGTGGAGKMALFSAEKVKA